MNTEDTRWDRGGTEKLRDTDRSVGETETTGREPDVYMGRSARETQLLELTRRARQGASVQTGRSAGSSRTQSEGDVRRSSRTEAGVETRSSRTQSEGDVRRSSRMETGAETRSSRIRSEEDVPRNSRIRGEEDTPRSSRIRSEEDTTRSSRIRGEEDAPRSSRTRTSEEKRRTVGAAAGTARASAARTARRTAAGADSTPAAGEGPVSDSYDARRAQREKRRREEMRARQERMRLIRLICAGCAALALVLLLFLGIRAVIRNTKSGQGKTTQTVSSGKKEVTVTDGKDQKAQEAQNGQNGQNGQEAQTETEPETQGRDLLAEAKLLAAGYDYDGAIALLGNYNGPEDVTKQIADWNKAKGECVAVNVDTVPHVFFHSLINDDRAFNADLIGADRVRQNNAAMTTSVEFDAMMEQMYNAGYVLVSLDDMCIKKKGEDGTVHVERNTSLMLPPGKKAFVLSIDDLSYYHSYGIGTQGYATRMLVDENGKPKCEYTDENGQTTIGDYDVVPRLDTFIENHPDFAYHGARGTVAMTGYNGVFGYRTNDYYKDVNDPHLDPDQILWLQEHPDFNWEEDCRRAKEVADAMKAEGWTFASHTYGHLNAGSCDLERLQHDHERWKTVNSPILGETDKIIFAFGADIGFVGEYTPNNAKYQYFKGEGFNIFCNVDGNIGWTEFGDTFMRTGRVALDGFTMYQAMTPDAPVHSVYANDYEALGISGIEGFFNKLRPTPINSE